MAAYDPTDFRGQERDKAEEAKRQQLAQKTEEDDFKWLMANRRGRAIIWRLLEQAGNFRISFNSNALQMAFNEGNRNSGLKILGMIHAVCPELYPTMVKEATHARNDRSGDHDN